MTDDVPKASTGVDRLDGRLGLVAIGRNEGQRLVRCLTSARRSLEAVVYVDSGSDDGSVAMARDLGVEVVELPTALPFTAARARNAGFRRLVERWPALELVQFVDGDCELADGWLEQAVAALDEDAGLAAVHGRRRERHPERSIYNELCDIEWAVDPGPVRYVGGDVMFRRVALEQAGGYLDEMIAGEEPELSVRLRAHEWTLRCIDHEMTLHDAAMTRFGQWWRRAERAGYAFALGASIHGSAPEFHWVRERRRPWIWAALVPLLVIVATGLLGVPGVLALALYPAQWLRIAVAIPGGGRKRVLLATSYTLGVFPELIGQLRFLRDRWSQSSSGLIEYK